MPRRALIAALAALALAWPVAADGPEGPDAVAEALPADDQCQPGAAGGSGASCALSALQLRGARHGSADEDETGDQQGVGHSEQPAADEEDDHMNVSHSGRRLRRRRKHDLTKKQFKKLNSTIVAVNEKIYGLQEDLDGFNDKLNVTNTKLMSSLKQTADKEDAMMQVASGAGHKVGARGVVFAGRPHRSLVPPRERFILKIARKTQKRLDHCWRQLTQIDRDLESMADKMTSNRRIANGYPVLAETHSEKPHSKAKHAKPTTARDDIENSVKLMDKQLKNFHKQFRNETAKYDELKDRVDRYISAGED